MSRVTSHMSISLDGFVAGSRQTAHHPRGRGWRRVDHGRLDARHPVDVECTKSLPGPKGAYAMRRNTYGPIRGDWEGDWRGWWGDEPPYHAPVFVMTHYEREP